MAMRQLFRLRLAPSALCAALLTIGAGTVQAEGLLGLTTTNALVSFDSGSPSGASAPVSITGLLGLEQIIGIDIRPANGALFGLGSAGRLYQIDPATGAASFVSSLSTALSGTKFGIDFNPVVDRLRVTSNTGQNLRINVDTGAVIVDTALNGGATASMGAAYTSSFPGAGSTTLYAINSTFDTLYRQMPNTGNLNPIGSLGVNTIGLVGFDISGASGTAFASLTDGDTGKSALYTIDLGTGAATLVGGLGIGGNSAIAAPLLDIAATAVPEPGTYGLMTLGALGIALRRRQARR